MSTDVFSYIMLITVFIIFLFSSMISILNQKEGFICSAVSDFLFRLIVIRLLIELGVKLNEIS